jgi:preprotein translocase SecF subunit
MLRILKKPNYRFIDHRFKGFALSAIAIMLGLFSLIIHQGPRYGIDFEEGTLIEFRFERPIDLEIIRGLVREAGITDAEVQEFGETTEIVMRTQEIGVEKGEITGFISRLRELSTDYPFEVMRTESVGPKIGGELKEKALTAILLSMLGLVIYISWRYEFKFAIAAIIALIHDVLITMGVFSLTDREISLAVVAAFLTIVGYSLNDTIVVFDRIREDLQIRRKIPYHEIINMSINETLSRTLITSLSTLVVVVCLYLFGGEVIKDFAFALIIGVLIGTYSSIYIASPFLIEWNKLFQKKEA